MKLIIAGGRNFADYNLLEKSVDEFIGDELVEIINGGAMGADSLGKWYATRKGLTITTLSAEWKKYGRAAGPKRNAEMAEEGDALIAFWDGESRGTRDMIRQATKKGLRVHVVKF